MELREETITIKTLCCDVCKTALIRVKEIIDENFKLLCKNCDKPTNIYPVINPQPYIPFPTSPWPYDPSNPYYRVTYI